MNIWLVIPAAGFGRRMGSGLPKQYLQVAGATVMEHTVNRLSALPEIRQTVVAIAPGDNIAPNLLFQHPERLRFVPGGQERADSVLAGLDALDGVAAADDWVLVHDVARPCVSLSDVRLLIDGLKDDPVGGILACPVRDTIKSAVAGEERIASTVPRETLWQAQTPQMFRYRLLRDALRRALADRLPVTDEASALELAGYQPRLVAGRADNIKITYPEDLALAGFLLENPS